MVTDLMSLCHAKELKYGMWQNHDLKTTVEENICDIDPGRNHTWIGSLTV